MTRNEGLAAVAKCICKDRNSAYGKPEDNFGRIASIANVVLAKKLSSPLTPTDVALFLCSVKLGRLAHGMSEDSFIDLAGYALCGLETEFAKPTNQSVE